MKKEEEAEYETLEQEVFKALDHQVRMLQPMVRLQPMIFYKYYRGCF
jgi:hypothetical protein